MASRLQQFATRNQKQGIEPKPVKHSVLRKADNIRRARHEPTLLDTDVESIGNATSLSFADFDEDLEPEDTRPALKDNRVFHGENAVKQEAVQHGYSSSPQVGWPSSWQLGIDQSAQPDWKSSQADPDATYRLHYQGLQETARLDDASSLPESSQDEHYARDPSPSPQSHDLDTTPKGRQLYERAANSPLEASKRTLHQTQWQTPTPPKIRPSTGHLGTLQAPDPHQQNNAHLLDYSPTALNRMPYSQLAEEPFERRPSQVEIDADAAEAARAEKTDAITIAERLRAIAASEGDDTARHAQLASFFAQLPLEQYETAGDAILEQFGAVFRSFQEIRQRKRAVAIEFERKVADREAAVSERRDALDRSASWLKRQGEDFIRGGPRE